MNFFAPRTSRRLLTLLFLVGGMFFVSVDHTLAATFTVNSNVNSDDGSCDHPFVSAATDCTLREAVAAANANVGTDTIVFDIDGSFANDGDGQWTITFTTSSLTITDPVIITGASAWDADDDRPGIKLSAANSVTGFVFSSGSEGSQIAGLEISGFGTSVRLATDDLTVGTDCDGVDDDVERNVLYGGNVQRVLLEGSNARVRGNYIGVRADGITIGGIGQYGIKLDGPDADDSIIGYEEGTSGVCPAAVQRNIIGGGTNQFNHRGIYLTSSIVSANDVGNAANAPDNNRISGNWVGVGADGVTDVGGLGQGILANNGSTLNFIGTDGDGVDDALEGNVISGWGGGNFADGITIFRTGYNRISGNLIGFLPDGDAALGSSGQGVSLRGEGTIAGWCDTSVHATLCTNSGSVTTQRNIVGNNTLDGIRFGSHCNDCFAYGNYIGTDGLGGDWGNGRYGFFSHRGNDTAILGGSGTNRQNLILFNDVGGVVVDGFFTGSAASGDPLWLVGPTENYAIENNVISENDGFGVWIVGTEQDGTVLGPSDGTIADNTISSNGAQGILLEGSSPTIEGNLIEDNATFGIEVRSSYRPDEPSSGPFFATGYDHPYDSLSPEEADHDKISNPIVTDNTIDGNTSGGILILDATASNLSTLGADNSIGVNGAFDVRQDWYLAVEVLTNSGTTITNDASVTLAPANSLSCTGTCTGMTFSSDGGSGGVWGPAGIDYHDAATWFQLTDFLVSTSGVRTDYNPYAVTASQSGTPLGSQLHTVDGDASDNSDTAGLPAGITTAGIDRYQIGELRQTTSGTSIKQPVGAPIAKTPVAISDSVIRWNFTDTATDETGFRLYRQVNGSRELLIDTGPNVVQNISFLEESGLSPSTQYCHRVVVAYSGAGESIGTTLPCATTLAPGELATDLRIPDVTVTQTLFYVPQEQLSSLTLSSLSKATATNGIPLVLLLTLIGVGIAHTEILRIRNCPNDTCRRVRNRHAVFALIFTTSLLGVFQFTSLPLANVHANFVYQPLTTDVQIRTGDLVRYEYLVTNAGDAAATNINFSTQITPGNDILPDSVRAAIVQTGRTLPTAILNGNLQVTIGDLPSISSAHIAFDTIIKQTSGFVTAEAGVQGTNIPPPTSNVQSFSVAPPGSPPTVPLRTRIPGMLLKSPIHPAVFFLDSLGRKRVFIDRFTYDSWYTDFRQVITISHETLISIPTGPAMKLRPGTWLVKIPAEPNVYAIEPDYVLRHVPSETRAEELYGQTWADQIVDLEPGVIAQYTFAEPLAEFEIPDATLYTNGASICYMEDDLCREISPEGKAANRFQDMFIRSMIDRVFTELPRKDRVDGVITSVQE